jgi:hypothetical protein
MDKIVDIDNQINEIVNYLDKSYKIYLDYPQYKPAFDQLLSNYYNSIKRILDGGYITPANLNACDNNGKPKEWFEKMQGWGIELV